MLTTLSTRAIVNIALDILATIVALILIACLKADDDSKEPLSQQLVSMLILNILGMAGSIASWLTAGSTEIPGMILLRVGTFSLYFFAYLIRFAMSRYLLDYISLKVNIPKRPLLLAHTAICTCCITILLISQWNGMCYSFDQNNLYCQGPLYPLIFLPGCMFYIIDIAVLRKYRKQIGARDMRTLLSFEATPLLCAFGQIFGYGSVLVHASCTLTLLIAYARMQIVQSARLKQRELELIDSRISIMLSQIQPHFLYNTLNTIEYLVRTDADQAAASVREFSAYLRENMDSLRQKDPVPFDRELKHVKAYLDIERLRFKERLSIQWDIQMTDFLLPILTVQPLVENAVRYGVTKRPQGGTLRIATRRENQDVTITISDDGMGFDPNHRPSDGRSHVGIANVRDRLLHCGGTLTIHSAPGQGTTATIRLPITKGERA